MNYSNPYGQNFPQESTGLANALLEYFQLPANKYSYEVLEQIDTQLDTVEDLTPFLKEYFWHAVALLGEAILWDYEGQWQMELANDGQSWLPYLLIDGRKYDVYTDLYKGFFEEELGGPLLSVTHIVLGAGIHMDKSMQQIERRKCAHDYEIRLIWTSPKSSYEASVQRYKASLQFLKTIHPSFGWLAGAGNTPLALHQTGNGAADWADLYSNDDDAQSHSFHIWCSRNIKMVSSLEVTINNAPEFETVNNEETARAIYTGLIELWQPYEATIEYKGKVQDTWRKHND